MRKTDASQIALRLRNCLSILDDPDLLPRPYDLYYAKSNKDGPGWTYQCAHVGIADIREALEIIEKVALAEREAAKICQCGDSRTSVFFKFDGGSICTDCKRPLPETSKQTVRYACSDCGKVSDEPTPCNCKKVDPVAIDEQLDLTAAKLAVDQWFKDGNDNRTSTEVEEFKSRIRQELLDAACALAAPYRDRAIEAEQKLAALATANNSQDNVVLSIPGRYDVLLSIRSNEFYLYNDSAKDGTYQITKLVPDHGGRSANFAKAAQIAYVICAETRHVSLGDKIVAAIKAEGAKVDL